MDCLVQICLAALVGLLVGFGIARLQDHFRLSSARASREEIVAQARLEAENFRKEAELKAKDEAFHRREEFNREIEQARNEVREQERRLEKREDTLDQKHQ